MYCEYYHYPSWSMGMGSRPPRCELYERIKGEDCQGDLLKCPYQNDALLQNSLKEKIDSLERQMKLDATRVKELRGLLLKVIEEERQV